MKPLLYTFVSEETLHSMAVTFYACVKLPIQIINEHGKTLVSEGESPHFCHLFQKHLPSYDSCEKMHISASKKAIDLGEAYIFACHADLNHIVYPLISKNVFLGSILVGPFLMDTPDSILISDITKKYTFSTEEALELYDETSSIPVIAPSLVNHVSHLLFYLFSNLITDSKKELLKNAIRKFAAHSARDNNTMEILEILTGKKPDRVLDPVLLYGFKKEKKDWNERLIKDRYLIIYAWGGTTVSVEFAENVQAFARKNGLKTVSVGDRRPWCDINYASATPIEFFELYRHCDMVITNMFHGTCFSIINEKPFYSVVMPHNQNKLKDLLEYLDLDKQILYTIDSLKEIEIPQINYSKVKENLESTKNLSMAYLNKAIANCRKE